MRITALETLRAKLGSAPPRSKRTSTSVLPRWHLALAAPNVREQEIARGMYFGWYAELVDCPPPIANGMISVPPGPGLGLALRPGWRSARTQCRA